MPHELRDPAYLWDMLDAARSIRRFTANVALDEYLRNEMMQLAVERQLMVIGEAARRVSENFRQSHPEIAWQAIIGQRNILAHEYGEVIQERIWAVVQTHIPTLIGLLEPLIPPLPSNTS